MKDNITTTWLRAIDSFKDVPLDQLQWFIDRGTVLDLPSGNNLFSKGDQMPGPFVILSGKLMLSVPRGQELHEAGIFETGAIGGYLPFSRGKFAGVVADVVEDMTYLQLPLGEIDEMIRTQFDLTQALVHVMANRIREATAFEQQNEKMMALGKLSAGLAHELNNPAAAVVRGSVSLLQHLKAVPDVFRQVMSLGLDRTEADHLTDIILNALLRTAKPELSMMERSSLEDDLLDWLDDNNIAEAAEIAESLVDFGLGTEELDKLKKEFSATAFPAVLNFIKSNLITEKIVMDIHEASGRISDLVGAVKSFTHMDQGHGKQFADIHNGIRSTLKMLQFKIRNANVQVVENFDSTLPEINAMIGELNQVWTNLLDNALDAMEGQKNGKLVITTLRNKECVRVTISDNGPGIPEDVKSRIFDPFFTTKQIGKGTGLGLDVVMRIIKQHKGAVKVQSRPGQTDFIVEMPIGH
ncbi:ATP-binding protein [Mucilaginibacter lutimaris]|uniref:histidine kinase n=1 Tax=Mucilaginibacter lutimaris TaxID=931629 RepID=A0ABW2ZED9_9SPHI